MTTPLPSKERLAEIHKLAAKSDKYIYHLRADEVEAMARALLSVREQEPVAVVEPSDYVTAAQISDDKPRKMAVRELYEGALIVGQNLYAHPAPVPAVPDERTWLFYCEKYPEMPMGDAIISAVEWNACRAAMLNGVKS